MRNTHTDIKPKQLLELAERIESAGGRPTCGAKPLEPQIDNMNSDDIAADDEPEIDVQVCSDDDDDRLVESSTSPSTSAASSMLQQLPQNCVMNAASRMLVGSMAAAAAVSFNAAAKGGSLGGSGRGVKLERSHAFSIAALMEK